VTELSPRPRRQEQEAASDDVTEVAPGVLRLMLPLAGFQGLGHVNCYALEDERGFALVDPGMMGPPSWRILERRLVAAGIPLRRVHTAVVTHSHPDHFGGAGFLRRKSGAEVITHRWFRTWWDPTEPGDGDLDDLPPLERPVGRQPWGGEGYEMPWRRRVAFKVSRRFPSLMGTPRPSIRLADAETVRLAGRDWVAVHTPGHTADHLCLFDPTEGTMLSGDHVLPSITPHISGLTSSDPLREFFTSLDKVAAFAGTRTVLPAHGHPFPDLSGRVEDIKRHHVERLDLLRAASAQLGRPASVMELSTFLFSARAQGQMADSETFAHLEHLRHAGLAERIECDGRFEYVVAH
jgi:glyoxylase-like metal-dependent hydrolase (beta-lactamase superfamily II)